MGGTPQQEIDRQYQQAVQLLQDGLTNAVAPSNHEISLQQKKRPTCELFSPSSPFETPSPPSPSSPPCPNPQAEANTTTLFPCWSSRGHADVSQLQSLLREGYNQKRSEQDAAVPASCEQHHARQRRIYTANDIGNSTDGSSTNLWDQANAAVHNVAICRPSHDAWGIKKVVLVFGDDFLRDIYQMPWWHLWSDMRDAVQPILNQLGISQDRIARLLFASLPPGVTIPVHHDTGEWVKHTHRVHVPILVKNPNRIVFQCGLTLDKLQRIDCTPGHVFEINNQAKHAVSNTDDDYRVHLILDYVDADFDMRPPIQLQPGERILQTRRSIDRLADRGQRPTPSFLILGAQKAGTTSLYEYMVQHPLVLRPRRRETHCLDWRWNDKCETTAARRAWCHKFYHVNDLQLHPSLLTGDSTPSYLLDSRRVIPRLQEVFNWKIKFLIMLRNPVKRAESHYAMVTSTEGTEAQLKARGKEWRAKTFHQVVMQDLHKMQDCGLIPYWNMQEGTVDQEIFDSFTGSPAEDEAWDRYLQGIPLNTGSYCLLGRGMYELNIRPWLKAFERTDFLVLRLEAMKERGVKATMRQVWQHLDVPIVDMEDEGPKNTRDYESIVEDDMQGYLNRFFRPHNRCLASILGQDWQNAWGCDD